MHKTSHIHTHTHLNLWPEICAVFKQLFSFLQIPCNSKKNKNKKKGGRLIVYTRVTTYQ